jgi:hypothetical protein
MPRCPGAFRTLGAEQYVFPLAPHPPALFEHHVNGIQRVGIGVQAAGIAPRHRRFVPAARALVNEGGGE